MAYGTCTFDSRASLEARFLCRTETIMLPVKLDELAVLNSGVLEYTHALVSHRRTIKVRDIFNLPVAVGDADTNYGATVISGGVRGCLVLSCSVKGVLRQIHEALTIQKQIHPGFLELMNTLRNGSSHSMASHRALFPGVTNAEKEAPQVSDVLLVCENMTFKCHRAILVEQSTTFGAMFKGDFAESTDASVYIDDVTGDTMLEILRFIYCGYIDVDITSSSVMPDTQHEMIYAAVKYNLVQLVDYLLSGFDENLNAETACRYLVWADRFGLESLKRSCFDVMMKRTNQATVADSPEWQSILSNKQLMTDIYRLAARD